MVRFFPCLAVSTCLALIAAAAQTPPVNDEAGDEVDLDRLGHSAHGEAFDRGPRQRPWLIEGIGATHFPVTSDVPEVQVWFDQGHTLLHSFWFHEAERAFRWCLKLDPECAMAYWGLARAVGRRGGNERVPVILREALRRRERVSERERRYLDAWQKATDMRSGRQSFQTMADELEEIVIADPDDVEAKALFLLYSLYRSSQVGNDRVGREILAADPDHVGAHHYLIHNWDDAEHGDQVLDSCEQYGRIAWNVGHANHMPGHVYSGLGMWHEAAIWMDSATRVEKRYMQERMVLPFQDWNYAHNRNYLAFIQEQLGLADAALQGARDLLAAPLDPDANPRAGGGVHEQGRQALRRGLIRFERWAEILQEDAIDWGETPRHRAWRSYAEGLAHVHLGDLPAARERLEALEALVDDGDAGRFAEIQKLELEALVLLEAGEALDGLRRLADAAEREAEMRERVDDPPVYPLCVYNRLGEQYLAHGAAGLAVEAFERALECLPNDGWALAGLVRSFAALGRTAEARDALGRLEFVWSEADPELRWLAEARALGLDAEPVDRSLKPQRRYRAETLDRLGPAIWVPHDAPELAALDAAGRTRTLADHRGRHVLLVFYIGEQCVHCVEQLAAVRDNANEFTLRDTDVLAVSSDPPERNAASEQMAAFPFPLLSDVDHEMARRFKSYDDFEQIELHSTILIDREGRVRWARHGGEPFTDMKFLLEEIDRIEAPEPAGEAGG